ncbi:N-acetylglucosamine-6-phosphate deacetylase [Gallalistipes aquisgranensis]|uniref:N-acetylglucosamine-6-phosphate deacetylase n=1 Tax=Gallalistipes aquisgranensis TaxID=2779358 RepID=UPI001CF86DE9|nr:N-acetylglucosamine-6-phosphate deacetylase [Gallalistipes aquisgranensis]MBE5032378.1 N-acetylglucosamine-6-phosphate deacetylase [Gallalistipes aquisgranensis]
MKRVKITNGRILTPWRDLGTGCVVVEDGVIRDVRAGDIEVQDAEVVDAGGCYVAPGFIEMHSHGAGGHDFMDATVEAFTGAARMHAMHGTTLICPTTIASTVEGLMKTFAVYDEALKANTAGAAFCGLHLEGPYFSYEQRGAQDPKYLRNPQPEEYMAILDATDHIARWSLAPELPGAMAFGRELVRRGIKPAIAHTSATYDEVAEAFDNGFRHLTHFYSCMSTITRRDGFRYPGVIESGFIIGEMTLELIADGCHVPPSLLKLVYDVKGASRVALVTDSMRAAGMGDGPSILGSLAEGQEVIVEDGVAKLLDRKAFAGSVATADRLIRVMRDACGIPMHETVRMMTSTPASILGVEGRKGSLVPGKDADIVIFDEKTDVKLTMIGGNIIYRKQS